MTLWRLTLPDVIPEDSLPFIDDVRLTTRANPIYCLKDRIPQTGDWERVLDTLHGSEGQGLYRPWRAWVNQKIRAYYPKPSTLSGAFWDADVSDMNFNISEFPSAQVFATLARVQCVDLTKLKS